MPMLQWRPEIFQTIFENFWCFSANLICKKLYYVLFFRKTAILWFKSSTEKNWKVRNEKLHRFFDKNELFRKFSCQVLQNSRDTVWIHPVQPEKEHLQRNDISDLNLNQRRLPPVRKYQIVFQSENFLFSIQNRCCRSKMV